MKYTRRVLSYIFQDLEEMRRIGVSGAKWRSVRMHSSYGTSILDHADLAARVEFYPRKTGSSVLSLLEKTENTIAKWKLNKWEFRIPPLLSSYDKEKWTLQLNILKAFFIERGKILENIKWDKKVVSSLGEIPSGEVLSKNRIWVQEKVSQLRWNGEVDKAKMLRDSFSRLEIFGARDHRILERLCAVYGLGLMNTFEDAFDNCIIEDEITKTRSVVKDNFFRELLKVLVIEYPYISLLYDFLGFNATAGYRTSLGLLLKKGAELKHNLHNHQNGRMLINDPRKKVILFDVMESKSLIAADDSIYGLPDFLYICGSNFFLITIASDNFWLRNRQLPHTKQMEGIGRRGSFVLGIPFCDVRIKNVLLPPNYLDKASLSRLLENVLELSTDKSLLIFPWVNLYEKELDESDLDFCEMVKRNAHEEWVTL